MQQQRELSLSDVPAIGFAIASLGGAAISLIVAPNQITALVVSSIVTALAFIALLTVRKRSVVSIIVYVAIAVVVFTRGNADLARSERNTVTEFVSDTAIVACRGVVVWKEEARQANRSDRFWLDNVRIGLPDSTIELKELRVRLSVPIANATEIRIGDVIAFNAQLESAHKIQERSVRELCWTLRERLIASARLKDTESLIVVSGNWSIRYAVFKARQNIKAVFERYLRPDAQAVAGALLLGSRETFSTEFRNDLQLTGLAHLFALSGLNTGLMVSLLWLLLAWLRVPGRIRYILLLLLLIGYTILGLGVPSLFRSAVMAGLLIIARFLGRPSHPINLLLFAAGIELLIWPLHILDAGFLLSYLSMAGILAAYLALQKPLQDLLQAGTQTLRRRTADTMSSTIGAQLATAPTVALWFGRVPGFAIIANVIAIPLFSLLVVLILCLMFLDLISQTAASAIARSIEGLVGVFAWLTSGAATVAGASLATSAPLWANCAAIVTQIAAILFCLRSRNASAVAFTLVALNLLIWPGRFKSIESATVLTVSASESPVLYARVGEFSILLGCGAEWNANRIVDEINAALYHDGLSTIDMLVVDSRASHHIGGAPKVLAAVRPEIVLDLSSHRDTHASELFDAVILTEGKSRMCGASGAAWQKNGATLQIHTIDDNADSRTWSLSLSDSSASILITKNENCDSTIEATNDRQIDISYSAPLQKQTFTFSAGKWNEVKPMTSSLMRLMQLSPNEKA